ncbi:MAG: hypothetical protein ACFE8B_11605 [Candidatus Hermodarchaeota archaeon]
MLIREAGILINKVPIIYANYPRANKEELDLIFTSELLRGLLNFTESIMIPIEYFENHKYTILFKKGSIRDYCGKIQEVTVFLVMDKDKKLEKYLYKKINPLLEEILREFVLQFSGCKITKVAQFEPFEMMINKIFC